MKHLVPISSVLTDRDNVLSSQLNLEDSPNSMAAIKEERDLKLRRVLISNIELNKGYLR